MMEFHIARAARERYGFAGTLFSYTGNVVLGSMAQCRDFAHRMNQVRDVEKHPEQAVHAGSLYAMGLIDEACHVLMARYREQFDPEVLTSALDWFGEQLGSDNLDTLLLAFVEQFPGSTIIRGVETPAKWLAGEAGGMTNREAALEELLMLWMANRNEAFKPFAELFDDSSLAAKTVYKEVTAQLPEYFATRPLIPLAGASPLSLLDLLRSPALRSATSLAEQLEILRGLWRPLLGDMLDRMISIAGEVLREESLAIWAQFNPPGRRTPEEEARRQSQQQHWTEVIATAEVPTFGDPAHEYEKFSPDTNWMPSVVMMAKSTYVWLAQMSRQYGRHIGHLDEIPDQELATLARRGINTLWLIGIWERSRASRTIKQLMGAQDAVASAYSLFDYIIADDLGGEAAYTNLRDRAYHHGIRLASDMVPNHMGIDSPWVVEHPEWFLSRTDSPYPAYGFNGPDLSSDNRAEIKIEDHYFTQSDAAVVFRRRDKASGETRYIYHGNDGTSFPWNDTAQLDYMNPAVREHVIQTILHVARLFPVIRFDAAMTLAKRHFHRLWFPGPGASGAIPSRAEYGLTQPEFDQQMPYEFWREVVDRVAAEVPGTLLLAEAFWLMEGYFVRTLGMHRVYNSAFMVMLRDEDNAKYRSVIKNTLEFDPDIMKRYVNFMSNPDERTAIDQFGKGDKCFGVAVTMATLPGLPMFGHGQIEGYTEKYGMEYRWPRYQENADPWLVERHEREIAPLLKQRWLFAESDEFLLYDFYSVSGGVDENVFAYSNRRGDHRALVLFNNRYGSTRGSVDNSAAYADKVSGQLRQRRLREGLGLSGDRSVVLSFRDSLTGLEYLRRAADVLDRGLTLDLNAYQCHVLLDWRELRPTAAEPWDRLADVLNGRGVPNLHDELLNLELKPVHDALKALLDATLVREFATFAEHPPKAVHAEEPKSERERKQYFARVRERAGVFVEVAVKAYTLHLKRAGIAAPEAEPVEFEVLSDSLRTRLRAAQRLPVLESQFAEPWPATARRVLPSASPEVAAAALWGPVLAWCILDLLGDAVDPEIPDLIRIDLFDRLRLRQPIAEAMAALGLEGEENWRVAARIKAGLLVAAGIGVEAPAVELEEAIPASAEVEAAISEQVEEIVAALDTVVEEPVTPAAVVSSMIAPLLWTDPDIRWLAGAHESGGHEYIVRESYEELLWWLELPKLLELAADSSIALVCASDVLAPITAALVEAEAAGYRADLLEGKFDLAEAEPQQPAEAVSIEKPETAEQDSAEDGGLI